MSGHILRHNGGSSSRQAAESGNGKPRPDQAPWTSHRGSSSRATQLLQTEFWSSLGTTTRRHPGASLVQTHDLSLCFREIGHSSLKYPARCRLTDSL